ncbi:hypothetical protein SAMN05216412_104148 [Nitrosospira multiformis]|uniref:Uncharacterized protein n=1 Tax=Nitrosospira multiformis TaxID=1231 RepID=A0A1I0CYD5_9PROT|nr:hypothetical protein SAMN05216412_104148 [Nitrosospira multiformis]
MCRAAIRPIRSNPAYSRSTSSRLNRCLPVHLALVFATLLAGCAGKPVIQTQVIEKPVAVPCLVDSPPECKSAYAVDRVSVKDDPLTINRALRTEIEERSACEVKLLAALRGCKKGMRSM